MILGGLKGRGPNPPPPPSHSGPRVELISAEGDTDLSSRTKQMRFLVEQLHIGRPQAHALLRAYEADRADAVRVGNDSGRPDDEFLAWLMCQAPGGRRPPVRKWRVGEAGWRTSS